MHGLTIFQHHIVGDVHQVVDGTHAAGTETFPHPAGRRTDLHVLYHAGNIARAELCIFHCHSQAVAQLVLGTVEFRCFQIQGLAESYGSLSRQTYYRQAVRTVGGDLELYRSIIQTDRLVDVLSRLAVLFNEEDAVLNGIGEIVLGQTQFTQRAEHPVALYATELSLFYMYTAGQICADHRHRHQCALHNILCAGHDLDRCISANVYLADLEMVGVLVGRNGNQLADNDILDSVAFCFISFYLRAAHGHAGAEFLDGNAAVHIISQPFHR